MNEANKKAQVQEFFGKATAFYAENPSHRHGADLQMLVTALAPKPGDLALDVATAAGHTAHALAPHVAQVVGLDLTAEMQVQFERGAAERGLSNVRFIVGDAEALPFADASFNIVTVRRAAHHFPNIEKALAEMARVLQPGGRLGVVDMVAPENPAGARLLNELEIARDSSHVRAYSASEWRTNVTLAGLEIVSAEIQEEHMNWMQWLKPRAADSPEAAAAGLAYMRAPAEARAYVASDGPDGRTFFKRRIVLVARKPQGSLLPSAASR